MIQNRIVLKSTFIGAISMLLVPATTMLAFIFLNSKHVFLKDSEKIEMQAVDLGFALNPASLD